MAEYRIDDLSRAAGTTNRNVRVYQERGILAKPKIIGRVGWYSEEHLIRLRLICQLVDRGYPLVGVADLLEIWERGGDLRDVLGLEAVLTKPLTPETPTTMTMRELRAQFGRQLTTKNLQRVVRLGLLERHGPGVFRIPLPGVIDTGRQLVEFGISLEVVIDIAEGLQHSAADIARSFVNPVRDQLIPDARAPRPEDFPALGKVIEQLRPLALSATNSVLAQALQREITRALEDVVANAGDAPQTAPAAPPE